MGSARKLASRKRFEKVDVRPSDAGFILSIGSMSVFVTQDTAEEIVVALLDSMDAENQRFGRRREVPKVVESILDLSILDLCDRRRWN
jgi:hypothetical protein